MNSTHQEIEVKFHVSDLKDVEARLRALGARRLHPRAHELNIRYDRPDGSLRREHRALRLRRSEGEARLTYKGPSTVVDGAMSRKEIEFAVGDFGSLNTLVMLDELPLDNFIEIEGADAASIRRVAERLGLEWKDAIAESYLKMFERMREERGLTFRDLIFENFSGKKYSDR
jgi:adenylate cyclase class IV